MVEAKLRVETTDARNYSNPFYGNVLAKDVIEQILYCDKDARGNIAPSGIKAALKLANNVVMDITISRHYLDEEVGGGFDCFYCSFKADGKFYKVHVWFDCGNIKGVSLSEWFFFGDYEDGEDANRIYKKDKDFVYCTSYIC